MNDEVQIANQETELEELRQRVAELETAREQAETLRAVTQALSTTLDLQKVFELILSELQKVVPYDSSSVQQLQGNHLVIVGGHGFENLSELLGFRFDPTNRDDPAREVIRTRQPFIVDDVSERYAHFKNRIHGKGRIRSWMGVPLLFGDRMIGMITIDKNEADFYAPEHARLAQAFASQAATAIENARLYAETVQAKETAEILQSANIALTQNLSLDTIFDTLLDYLCRVVPYDSVSIFLREGETRLTARAVRGYEQWVDAELARSVSFEFKNSPHINAVIVQQTSMIIPDTHHYADWVRVPSSAHVRNWLAVPLVAGGKTIGLYSLDKTEPDFFTDEHRRMAEALATQAAIAIQNAMLFESEMAARRQAQQRSEQMSALYRVAQAATSVLELQAILETMAHEMMKLLNARSTGVGLLNPDRTEINVVAYASQSEEQSPVGLRIPLAGNIATQQVIDTRRSIVIPDAQNTPLQDESTRAVMRARNTHCILITPLLTQGKVIGTIGPDTDQPDRVFTPDEVELAETIASQMAGVIEKARLFEEAEAARAAAEAANEAKSAFLASVSHELRTPLTSVLGFAKIIQKRLETRIFPHVDLDIPKVERSMQQVSENIEIIIDEGERLTSLINNLLDLAKIESGKLEWRLEDLDIADVVHRAISATASLFDGKTISLIEEVPENLPLITGDRDRLIQVVINLISNAVKFTEKGSVTCQVRQNEGEIVVSIIDTGIGIPAEYLEKVFEKFVQVGDTLSDKPKGTGLGLPICKEIIEYHGGRIWLESQPGQGSNFSFSLPAGTAADLEPQTVNLEDLVGALKEQVVDSSFPAGEKPRQILVVDDDAHVRELLRQELEAEGYRVQEARDGLEAIQRAKATLPDLVILDVRMPGMNGFDAAAVLKNNPETMGVPIMILSIVEDRERGYRLGVDRYLTKPIDPATLLHEIETLLDQRASQQNILVVDKNMDTVQALTAVLRAKGYRVLAATSREEFLEKAFQEKPGLVLVNALFSDQAEIVQALRFEKEMENIVILFYQ